MADTRKNESQLLELLCRCHPNGMSSRELGNELGITAETVRQMINRIDDDTGIYQEGEARATRYFLNPKHYKRPFNLTTTQSWMLYLSIRRIVRAQQHRLPVVKHLIQDLARALHPRLAENFDIPDTDNQDADLFEKVVEAWQTHRWLKVSYRPLNKTTAHEWVIAPLWFEPAIWSDSNYVICHVQMGNTLKWMTLKLDRIEKVFITGDKFEAQPIDSILNTLQKTWGIWVGEGAPVRVVLHFDLRVLDRLRETRWHPTQKLTNLDNGKIQWEALISEPREMLSWIRGWGADVEVIEPNFLRDEIGAESERMARMYGRMNTQRKGFI
ncbi:MAG: WYL domain-containing protein [Phototrophicales bacterium]|nr:WYL domain-containing protein [Phototrophicales bacterium]